MNHVELNTMKPYEFPKEIVPGEYAVTPDAPKGSHDEKTPPLSALYPERDKYLNVEVSRYYSKEFMQKEWDKVWTKTWTCAGRETNLPSIGSWFKYDLGLESFLITRSGKGEIKAFYNVCRHRGNQLVHEDSGKRNKFTCSFHGWQWQPDGKLALITDASTFKPEALTDNLDLKPVRCETWAGFVFINMDDNAAPLMEFLGDIPRVMSSYQMEKMHVVKDVVVEFDTNWKVTWEAFIESYHLQVTHAQAKPAVDDVAYQIDYYRNGHARLHTALGIPSPRCEDRTTLDPILSYMLMEAGLDPAKFAGRAMEVRAAIAAAKRRPDNAYGIDYSGFSDSQVTDDWNYSIFPNMTFNTHPEGVLVMRFLPHSTDPQKCYYHVWIISRELKDGTRPPAYMGVEDDVDISGKTRPARRYNHKSKPELGEVLEQDIANVEGVQRGLRSRGFDHNKYCEQETRIMQFYAEMDRWFAH
jgi:phenylpropionate dioxygenase-like ring-hydroxylating dioxygenase large terminal subunit